MIRPKVRKLVTTAVPRVGKFHPDGGFLDSDVKDRVELAQIS